MLIGDVRRRCNRASARKPVPSTTGMSVRLPERGGGVRPPSSHRAAHPRRPLQRRERTPVGWCCARTPSKLHVRALARAHTMRADARTAASSCARAKSRQQPDASPPPSESCARPPRAHTHFTARARDEIRNGETFDSVQEAAAEKFAIGFFSRFVWVQTPWRVCAFPSSSPTAPRPFAAPARTHDRGPVLQPVVQLRRHGRLVHPPHRRPAEGARPSQGNKKPPRAYPPPPPMNFFGTGLHCFANC